MDEAEAMRRGVVVTVVNAWMSGSVGGVLVIVIVIAAVVQCTVLRPPYGVVVERTKIPDVGGGTNERSAHGVCMDVCKLNMGQGGRGGGKGRIEG